MDSFSLPRVRKPPLFTDAGQFGTTAFWPLLLVEGFSLFRSSVHCANYSDLVVGSRAGGQFVLEERSIKKPRHTKEIRMGQTVRFVPRV